VVTCKIKHFTTFYVHDIVAEVDGSKTFLECFGNVLGLFYISSPPIFNMCSINTCKRFVQVSGNHS